MYSADARTAAEHARGDRTPFDAASFCQTLAANLNNQQLDDASFRQFVRNSIPSLDAQRATEIARRASRQE